MDIIRDLRNKIEVCDTEKPYIFISYARENCEVVYKDVIELQKRGVNLWIDKELNTKLGTSWKEEAYQYIEKQNCIAIVFYISEKSMISEAVKEELNHRRDKKTIRRHDHDILKMIPIAIDEIENIATWVKKDVINEQFKNKQIGENEFDTACEILEEEFNDNNDITRIQRPKEGSNAEDFTEYYEIITANFKEIDPRIISIENVVKSESSPKSEIQIRDSSDILNQNEVSKSINVQNNTNDKEKDLKVNNKSSQVKTEFTPETVTPVEKTIKGNITLREVRDRFANDIKFCEIVGDVRKNQLPYGGKSYMDYAMAAILGGCNNVEKEKYRLNYYLYAIADQNNKKDDSKPGATWTWSSNSRKTIGETGSGQLDKEINTYFEEISPETTVNQIIEKFEKMEEKAFTTKKNSLAIIGLQKIIECWN